MAKGKKTPPETVYAVMASYAVTHNQRETARLLGLSSTTVRKIIKDNENNSEFEQLCAEKKQGFSDKATVIIDKALERLEHEIENPKAKIPINHLTTVIGTLYDKRALAEGKPTENVGIIGDTDINKLAELAGYEKR